MATDTLPNRDSISSLRAGWQPSAVVSGLGKLSYERRTTVYAVVFAIAAAAWAPLGIVAFFGHWLGTFALVTGIVLAVALAPLPVGLADQARSLGETAADTMRSVVDTMRPVVESVVETTRDLVRSLGQSMPRSAR